MSLRISQRRTQRAAWRVPAAAVLAAVFALAFAIGGDAAVRLADGSADGPAPPTLVAQGVVFEATAPFYVHGVGEPGAEVKVFDGGSLASTTTADGSGFYSAPLSFLVGTHPLTATQTVGGLTSAPTSAVPVTVAYPPMAQQGAKLTGAGESGQGSFGTDVALSTDGNTALVGGPNDSDGVGAAWVFTRSGTTWSPQGGALSAIGESGPAAFGVSVALSGDGNTALIGGSGDDEGAGAAWVFTRSGSTWTQSGSKLTVAGSGAGLFGTDVALSADGSTAVIGAPADDGGVGAAWVFTRSGQAWSQQGPKLTGGGEAGEGAFGASVAVSANGNTALVGGPRDSSDQYGAVWPFTRSAGTWSQQGAKLTSNSTLEGGWLGWSVALSGDGNVAYWGSYPDRASEGITRSAVRDGGTWTSLNTGTAFDSTDAYFGYGVGLSADGNIAVGGGPAASGGTGAVWIFSRGSTNWEQRTKLTGTGASGPAGLGAAVATSVDGSTVLAGGPDDNGFAGAAWVFAPSTPAPPAAPTNVSAVPGLGRATVSFTPPAGTVTSYTVIAVPGGAAATGIGSQVVVTGLANGTAYTFRVVANHDAGAGPASAPSNAVLPGIPTQPANVTAVAGDATARVDWSAPATDGGSAITGYVVTPYARGVAQTPVAVGPVTTTSFNGLTNGTGYTFTVSAVNALGTGPASTSGVVVPTVPRALVPDAPPPEPRPGLPDTASIGTIRPPLPVR